MERNHTTEMACSKEIEIDMRDCEDPLENLLQRRLNELPGEAGESKPITIPRIPSDILERNKAYYEPRAVSIGPYYHGMERYRDMEQHKMRYLRDFLSRHEVGVEVLVKEMRALEARARQCYSGFISLDSERFVEMLLLDGCFILEVWSKKLHNKYDALLDISWVLMSITTDFLLLENQIPFFVIHKLYSTSFPGLLLERECGERILNSLTKFVQWRAPMWVRTRQFETPQGEIHHLLHFYQEFHAPKKTKLQISSDQTVQSSMVRICFHYLKSFFISEAAQEGGLYVMASATDLSEAGVVFRKKPLPNHFLDITFKNGIFEMPTVAPGVDEKIIILNLIAWNGKIKSELGKQSNNSSYLYPFSSYILLLGSLLRTKNDIELLKAQGIIDNDDSSDEELANFFNHLGDLNMIGRGESHYCADLFSDTKRYYDGSWHRHRARLKRDYFSSPWSIISIVAGTILMFLTGIQTFYAIYPYARH